MNLAQGLVIPTPDVLKDSKISLDYKDFLGSFFSRMLAFAILLAGLFFMAKLVNAGYIYLTSIGEPNKIQAATKEITNAAIGLMLVISTFFIIQIFQTVLGLKIL